MKGFPSQVKDQIFKDFNYKLIDILTYNYNKIHKIAIFIYKY